MHAPGRIYVERQMELAAAAIFGGAVGYATCVAGEAALAYGCAAGLVAFFLCFKTLSGWHLKPHFTVASFAPRMLEFSELEELLLTPADQVPSPAIKSDELLLTESDRLGSVPGAETEPLILDDVLSEIGPDSRVVRLFDRKAMPTPGEMKSRIDDHLQRPSGQGLPDASEALSNALAELRRSLR